MRRSPILLVEDNPDDEELCLLSLHDAKLENEIHVVRDGTEACEYLFSGERPLPVLVMLDLKLPKIDGFEVLRRIRETESTRLLPVVILTSSDVDEDILSSYRLGANSYVRKPVEFSEFTAAVKQLGLYWILLNEPSERT